MRRLVVFLVAAALAATLASPIAAAGPQQGGTRSGFVGAFDVDAGGPTIGRVIARLSEPSDQRLVAGALDFQGVPGAVLRESHIQFALAYFNVDPDWPPDSLGMNVALGEGVECRYTGPNEAACRQIQVQFIDYLDPGIPSQLDFSTWDGEQWAFSGETWKVEGGSFELYVAPGG